MNKGKRTLEEALNESTDRDRKVGFIKLALDWMGLKPLTVNEYGATAVAKRPESWGTTQKRPIPKSFVFHFDINQHGPWLDFVSKELQNDWLLGHSAFGNLNDYWNAVKSGYPNTTWVHDKNGDIRFGIQDEREDSRFPWEKTNQKISEVEEESPESGAEDTSINAEEAPITRRAIQIADSIAEGEGLSFNYEKLGPSDLGTDFNFYFMKGQTEKKLRITIAEPDETSDRRYIKINGWGKIVSPKKFTITVRAEIYRAFFDTYKDRF